MPLLHFLRTILTGSQSNLAKRFVFQRGAISGAMTHRCHIFEMNGEGYRFRESMKETRVKGQLLASGPRWGQTDIRTCRDAS